MGAINLTNKIDKLLTPEEVSQLTAIHEFKGGTDSFVLISARSRFREHLLICRMTAK